MLILLAFHNTIREFAILSENSRLRGEIIGFLRLGSSLELWLLECLHSASRPFVFYRQSFFSPLIIFSITLLELLYKDVKFERVEERGGLVKERGGQKEGIVMIGMIKGRIVKGKIVLRIEEINYKHREKSGKN